MQGNWCVEPLAETFHLIQTCHVSSFMLRFLHIHFGTYADTHIHLRPMCVHTSCFHIYARLMCTHDSCLTLARLLRLTTHVHADITLLTCTLDLCARTTHVTFMHDLFDLRVMCMQIHIHSFTIHVHADAQLRFMHPSMTHSCPRHSCARTYIYRCTHYLCHSCSCRCTFIPFTSRFMHPRTTAVMAIHSLSMSASVASSAVAGDCFPVSGSIL